MSGLKGKHLIVLFLFSLLLFISCVQANDEEYTDSTKISVIVFTDKTVYATNETMIIYINVTNPTDSTIKLQFTSSQQFDYEIRDNRGLVYRWSDDKAFLTVLTSITIPAGEFYVASFTHTSQDCSLKPGTYVIAGLVIGYDTDSAVMEVTGKSLPEFPLHLTLLLFMIATLLAVIFYRRKHTCMHA